MKKIIGILGIAMIAMAMFLNTSALTNLNGNLDLASLAIINTANAEDGSGGDRYYSLGEDGTNICHCSTSGTKCVCL